MMELQAIWIFVVHYGYEAVMEFVVEIGDHFVSHYFLVLVVKAGVIHVGWIAFKRVRKARATKGE